MKKLLSFVSIMFIALFLSTNVFAALVTFDDIPESAQYKFGPIPDGYAGFNWDSTNFISRMGYDTVHYYNSAGAISGDFVMLNYWGSTIITDIADEDFYYSGLYAKTWRNRDVSVEGYNNEVLVFSDDFLLTSNWQEYVSTNNNIPVDTLMLNFGSFFLVDNLDIGGPHTLPPLPVPTTILLLSSAMIGLITIKRKFI